MKKTLLGIGVFLLIVGIVVLAFTFIDLPRTTTESYQVPKSSDIIDESFTVPPETVTRTRSLTEGDSLNIQLEVTAGGNKDIDFSVTDGITTYISATRATTLDRDWTVPSNGTYYFVYDNSFSWITSKDVTTKVTKHWTETNYRDVTKYYPLLYYEFSYVGLILSFAGIGIVIWGFVRKETPKPKAT